MGYSRNIRADVSGNLKVNGSNSELIFIYSRKKGRIKNE